MSCKEVPLSVSVRKALIISRDRAVLAGQECISTHHLLKGLLQIPNVRELVWEENMVPSELEARIEKKIEELGQRYLSVGDKNKAYLSNRVERILSVARTYCKNGGYESVSPEMVFDAFLEERHGLGIQIINDYLRDLGGY